WFLTPCGQKNGALRLCLANFEMASTQSESTFCGPRSALCFSVQALTMQPALSQIQNSADKISHMITQLLALARTDPVEGCHKMEKVDLYNCMYRIDSKSVREGYRNKF
ncbi:MAG: hypothetical protein ACKE51_02775, partial [Methylococcaceae bacterium]